MIGEPYQRKNMDEKIGETKINNRSGSGVFSFKNKEREAHNQRNPTASSRTTGTCS